MRYGWNPAKAEASRSKHGVRFADAVAGFSDERALRRHAQQEGEPLEETPRRVVRGELRRTA